MTTRAPVLRVSEPAGCRLVSLGPAAVLLSVSPPRSPRRARDGARVRVSARPRCARQVGRLAHAELRTSRVVMVSCRGRSWVARIPGEHAAGEGSTCASPAREHAPGEGRERTQVPATRAVARACEVSALTSSRQAARMAASRSRVCNRGGGRRARRSRRCTRRAQLQYERAHLRRASMSTDRGSLFKRIHLPLREPASVRAAVATKWRAVKLAVVRQRRACGRVAR